MANLPPGLENRKQFFQDATEQSVYKEVEGWLPGSASLKEALLYAGVGTEAGPERQLGAPRWPGRF